MTRARAAALVLLGVLAVAALEFLGWPASIYRSGLADMPQFWGAPRALLEGRSPYDEWSWPYPLWTAVALLPLGLFPLAVAAPLWLVAQLAAVLAALAALARRVLVSDEARDRVLLFGIAVAMPPTWLLVGGGNMTGLLFAAFAGAFVAALSGRPGLAGALLGLLVTKPMAFLVSAPVFVLVAPATVRPRLIATALAVVAALVAASFVLVPDWVAPWLTNVAALGGSTGSNATGWTAGRVAGPAPYATTTSAVGIVLILAAFAWWWARRRPPFALLVGASVPVSLYAAPHGWSYDQLQLLVSYAVVLDRISALGRERIAWIVALLLVACVLPWAFYASALASGGEDIAAVTPLLAFALVVAADARAHPAREVTAATGVA
ncbi:MAG: DUF2029 domain-containing protein [Chloroflexota bacterium]|nr:DUF2029 domain-containing protein [Chloroflexota bacterium]